MLMKKIHDYTLFFKKQIGFERLFKELYEKYKSYGKFTGKIKIKDLSIDEANAFSKLLGYHLEPHQDVTISIKEFLKIMEDTKYGKDFNINILVMEYLGVNLITNKENKLNSIEAEQKFYESFIKDGYSKGTSWFKEVISNHIVPYNLIHKRYLKNKSALKKEIELTITLISKGLIPRGSASK